MDIYTSAGNILAMKQIVFFVLLFGITLVVFAGSASAYSYCGFKWPGTTTTWTFDSSFPSNFRSAVQGADSTWDSAGSKFRFNYGTSSNKYYWGITSDPRYAGEFLYTIRGSPTGDILIWAGTILNKQKSWTTDCWMGGLMLDVQTVSLHEFGHWLCIKDDYASSHSSYVMYYAYTGCKRSLTTDDKTGIKNIYGV